ncbi:TNF receptor-associated factor 3-like [Pecten maximus]|uniref:TNF receptor-associated factor 3-like n=1 Tax=Pecten maximus TaxID=6579 RepID=UPI0014587224|nr:TNF receptor-associated factor 3-like [Pecten maximus]XP_033736032.1 TNF receptor-associated factor 3-like [Pecten maximus]
MASSSNALLSMINNPDPSETNPQFVKNTEEFEKCTACKTLLWNAYQLPCGHHVCPNGLERVLENGRCMVADCALECRQNEIFPDSCKRREIANLEVKCGNQGCQKTVRWGNLKNHERSCDYRLVECDLCHELVRMSSIQKHKDEECAQRILSCPNQCGVSAAAINLQKHLAEECPNVLMSCPNECGITPVSREELTHHANKCPLRRTICRFKDVGCPFQGLEHEVTKHAVDGLPYHVELIASRELVVENATKEHISDIKETINKILRQSEEMKKIQDANTKLKKECLMNKKSIQDMKKLLASQGEKVINVERQVEDKISNDRVDCIKRDLAAVKDTSEGARQRIETLEKATGSSDQSRGTGVQVVERVENQVRLLDGRVCEIDLRLQLLETINYNGVLMWKIRDYRRRKVEGINGKTLSLYSQPFYTSQYGYKLCGRVYLNGDGSGKGAYLSFFIVVMKGDFDALLPWPFISPTTLMVLDQNGTGLHVHETFTPNPTSNSFRKPATEMNVACGVPCFVKHTKLETDTYLKDDTIFLRAVVDCSKIKALY